MPNGRRSTTQPLPRVLYNTADRSRPQNEFAQLHAAVNPTSGNCSDARAAAGACAVEARDSRRFACGCGTYFAEGGARARHDVGMRKPSPISISSPRETPPRHPAPVPRAPERWPRRYVDGSPAAPAGDPTGRVCVSRLRAVRPRRRTRGWNSPAEGSSRPAARVPGCMHPARWHDDARSDAVRGPQPLRDAVFDGSSRLPGQRESPRASPIAHGYSATSSACGSVLPIGEPVEDFVDRGTRRNFSLPSHSWYATASEAQLAQGCALVFPCRIWSREVRSRGSQGSAQPPARRIV